MPESITHMELVQKLFDYVRDVWMDGDGGQILLDDQEWPTSARPYTVNGHTPDLYARNHATGLLVIGEAKTPHDLETKRTAMQLRSFLSRCSEESHSVFILAVRWYMTASALNLIRLTKRRHRLHSVPSVVINELGEPYGQ